MSTRPQLTNPLRPAARYRKGKAPVAAPLSDSDSDEEQQPSEDDGEGDVEKKKISVALKDVKVDRKGLVTVSGRSEVGRTEREQDDDDDQSGSEEESDEEVPKPKVTFKAPARPGEGDSEEEGSSEYETDSEEEAPAPLFKPVFVSKRNRDTITELAKELDPEVIEARRLAELEERKKQSHDLVAESIHRELAEKEAEQVFPDVDDTDELDPQGEFEAWKLRELMRIKRDREAQYAREKEREEVEARRALPEALRMKEDLERAQKTRDEKKKGQQVFLQKYHHKGAFYTDSEVLKKHDYTAPTVSTIKDASSLPAVMQKRNFGKAHQTKYTHLAAEDTTNPNAGWNKKPGAAPSAGCFICGGPHLRKDCPQAAQAGPSGSNSAGDSGWGARGGGRPSGDGDDDRFARGERGPDRRDDRYPTPRGGGRDEDRWGAPPRPRRDEDDRGRGYDKDRRGEWDRGGERQRERYAATERDTRDKDQYGSRGDERLEREARRERSPRRGERDERDERDEKRRRVD